MRGAEQRPLTERRLRASGVALVERPNACGEQKRSMLSIVGLEVIGDELELLCKGTFGGSLVEPIEEQRVGRETRRVAPKRTFEALDRRAPVPRSRLLRKADFERCGREGIDLDLDLSAGQARRQRAGSPALSARRRLARVRMVCMRSLSSRASPSSGSVTSTSDAAEDRTANAASGRSTV